MAAPQHVIQVALARIAGVEEGLPGQNVGQHGLLAHRRRWPDTIQSLADRAKKCITALVVLVKLQVVDPHPFTRFLQPGRHPLVRRPLQRCLDVGQVCAKQQDGPLLIRAGQRLSPLGGACAIPVAVGAPGCPRDRRVRSQHLSGKLAQQLVHVEPPNRLALHQRLVGKSQQVAQRSAGDLPGRVAVEPAATQRQRRQHPLLPPAEHLPGL